jgi:RNA polymerase sigma-70 factor (ECF subfamily)
MDGILATYRKLSAMLRRLGRSREEADDLIQEAFLRLQVYCQTHEVRQEEAFLVRTVRNLSVDAYRRAHLDLYATSDIETLSLRDWRPTPDEDLALQQRLDSARAVLDTLKPRTREIFLMHRVEGYSSAQIAERFSISVSAVEKHVARAVLALMSVVQS